MCLAIPGKIVACADAEATVDLQGNRISVSTALTPDAGVGDWVLIHAGFAITKLDEADALETWDYLRQAYGDDLGELDPSQGAPAAPGGAP